MSDYPGNAKVDDYNETGKTGLFQFSGYVFEDFLREFHGREAYKRFHEMRLNSPVVGALLTAIEQSIRKVTWTFTSEEGPADPRLEILENSMRHMTTSWGEHVMEALSMLPFGFALFEIVYQRWEDGSVIWKKLAPRGQDTVLHWYFNEEGGITGFQQQAPPHYELTDIPIEKLLLYRTRSEKNNPEGRSILRQAWIPYYYAKNLMQIEAIGVERDLAGLPVITLPSGATTDPNDKNSDAAKAAKMVRNIRVDEQMGIVLPTGWQLQLLSTGGSRAFDTNQIIARYESRIMMSALAQFLMLGQNGRGGSNALSQDQSHLFMEAVNAPADVIADEISHQAIPKLMKLNGYEADGLVLSHSAAGDVDINILAAALQQVQPFLSWTPQDEVWLRDVMRLPALAEEDIQVERDKRAAAASATLKALQGGMANSTAIAPAPQEPGGDRLTPGEEEQPTDQLSATVYAAGSDEERRLWEGRWKKFIRDFFSGQKRRVVKGARAIPR